MKDEKRENKEENSNKQGIGGAHRPVDAVRSCYYQ